MDYLFFSIALIVALVAGFILARKLAPKAGVDTGADEQKTILETQNSELKTQLTEAKNRADKLQENLSITQQQNARLSADKVNTEERLVEHKKDLTEMKTQFQAEFQNLAKNILKENSKDFSEQSQKDINTLLTPFKNNFEKLEATVKESFRNHSSQQSVLQKEIENVVKLHQEMTVETKDLTSALRGDSKIQGDWGEMVLERILEDSGLRKDHDYIVQGAGMGLKESETGKSQRPDVVIHLPDNKHLIIDSKVSLTHYVNFCSADSKDEKDKYLKQFLQSVKKHVTDLQNRGYEHIEKLGTPDYVFMFMPIEGAYALAMQNDNDLHRYAWDKKIVIVCPTTLFATLRTIASIWRLKLQNDNAIEIARQGGALYDKVVGFADDMLTVETALNKAQKFHKKALNKLSEGPGNILSWTQRLKTLGLKTKKSIPTKLLRDGMDDEPVAELPAPTPDPEH